MSDNNNVPRKKRAKKPVCTRTIRIDKRIIDCIYSYAEKNHRSGNAEIAYALQLYLETNMSFTKFNELFGDDYTRIRTGPKKIVSTGNPNNVSNSKESFINEASGDSAIEKPTTKRAHSSSPSTNYCCDDQDDDSDDRVHLNYGRISSNDDDADHEFGRAMDGKY